MQSEQDIEAYKAMQKRTYENPAKTPDQLVGHFEWNETVPYETQLLYERGDLRLPIFPSTKNLRALDFGCGPGRMVKRMMPFFRQVDGADISMNLIEAAKKECPDSEFFHTSGDDLGGAPKGAYDFIYSTIAMQHIAVHGIRMRLLNEMAKALAPGGQICLQFAFNRLFPLSAQRAEFAEPGNTRVVILNFEHQHARWDEDRTDAHGTNSACDVGIGVEDLPQVKEDFEKYFQDVRFWFWDFSHHNPLQRGEKVLIKTGTQTYWATHYLFINAKKK